MEANRPRDTAAWLERLRASLMNVAARRVAEGDLEDVVHDAMRIVVEKHIDPHSGVIENAPTLAWCFEVLRNAIGNYYRREGTRRRRLQGELDDSNAAAESTSRLAETLDAHETAVLIEGALREMHRTDPQCARYLSRLADEAQPRDIAAEEGLDPAVFYRRLYRCRQKLRAQLAAKGVDV